MTDPALLDAVMLSRIQFAANISFHILFPTISMGLAWLMVFFKVRYHLTGDAAWLRVYQFWLKIFALTFAVGVVTGITMSFQFGTNWPGYMNTVGNIAGPLLAYEVMTAFFLEATFLGIMLFGRGRVSETVHTLACFLVAFGTSMSAFWILALNSWMQTPAGFEMIDGKAHVTSWMAVIFNPSMPYRLAHMLLASGLTAAFLVAGISAYRWLRGDQTDEVRKALRTGVFLAAALIPAQIMLGDAHGLNTLAHQPAKVAAIEGVWTREASVPLLLFALPNAQEKRNDYAIGVPYGASLILTHSLHGELPGLDEFPQGHAPVAPVFWSFRVMVGMGMLMLAVAWGFAFLLWRRGNNLPRWPLRGLVAMTFSGWVATLAGWYVTEIGRQPWLVTNVLLTKDAIGAVPAATIFGSLTMYVLMYAFLLVAYVSVVFYLAQKAPHSIDHDALGGH
ncbi:cytochrome bd-I ubiquinol oxidase subunit 1 apoprotein [Paraperlucidibaca baekdonensis]|uniref:Cytochrome bd-I ubiquinol oxidase subunit 1 apoprotein n=1 Tax=Paraperlucidibaca baekdonensis TaxID=748120 RepID=A0A3E0H6Y2_9GAMM|nr:cytochrome ubiquinol oxidase subunit I [Paraperlucidibaca baekdonensis]REH39008.1 cytochrome bd-I ubiquinol oxidase subunit 1 apoprotein [Paraperlucidibaca baekdonensis]